PRPPNTVVWERTEAIAHALDRVLADPDRSVRLAVLRRMQREKVPTQLATLSRWLRAEREDSHVTAILDSLRDQPADKGPDELSDIARDKAHAPANRLTALTLLVSGLDESNAERLLPLAGALEDGPVLAETLRQLARRPKLQAGPLLLSKLHAAEAVVRAAA